MEDKKDKEQYSSPIPEGFESIEIDLLGFDSEPIDYYRRARDSYLKSIMPNYPNIDSFDVSICFSISPAAKNGVILYAILDKMPHDTYLISGNYVSIHTNNNQLKEYLWAIVDVLSVVKTWSTTIISCNSVELDYAGFNYLIHFFAEKNTIGLPQSLSTKELKQKYISPVRPKRKSTNDGLVEKVHLSRSHPHDALESVIQKYIQLFGKDKEVEVKAINQNEKVIVIENDFIIYFWLSPRSWRRLESDTGKDWEFPYINFQELTHNGLFKFNYASFARCFSYDYMGIDYFMFHGLDYYINEIDKFNYIDAALPELKLKDRLEHYPGETHHFILLKMEDVLGRIRYGIGETKQHVHPFVLKLCKELEEKNSRTLYLDGSSSLPFNENKDFISAFLSWTGKPKKWRLENKFSYTVIDQVIKNDINLFHIPEEIISKAYTGEYDNYDYGSYSKPDNRWKSEELVYNITKKLFKDHQVIYQYSPYYLATEKGCMSYDIYICGLKVAIEYQGQQHFEPVDYFGGNDTFEKQQERDKLKAERSKENGIKLIYINYWEDITPQLVKQKVEDAVNNPL